MPSNDEKKQSGIDKGDESADQSPEKEVPRYAGLQHDFDEDTDEAITLPKVKPGPTEDTDSDEKKADSAFDDLDIEVDEEEVKAESNGQPPVRKY